MLSKKTKLLVLAAFFVALDIIIGLLRFEVITPFGPMQFDFKIVSAVLCGYALGPAWGCLTLATADILGAFLHPSSLSIFIGFTISAALRGLLFGLFLHNKKLSSTRLIATIIPVFIITDILMSTLWIYILTTKAPYITLLVGRFLPKVGLMIAEIIAALGIGELYKIISKNKEPKNSLT